MNSISATNPHPKTFPAVSHTRGIFFVSPPYFNRRKKITTASPKFRRNDPRQEFSRGSVFH